MLEPLVRLALRLFGALPRRLRRIIVRAVTPSYTAGTSAIIEREDGRWLFVRPAYRDGWALPGGLLGRGESPEPAIHRELREELGVVVVVDHGPWVLIAPVLQRIDVVWRAHLAPGIDPDAVEIRTAELREVGWFDPDRVPVLEDEAGDVLALRRRIVEGGSAVLVV
ncbi:MAG: NUDIX hydrolase [Acidimicrobiales bacterium]